MRREDLLFLLMMLFWLLCSQTEQEKQNNGVTHQKERGRERDKGGGL